MKHNTATMEKKPPRKVTLDLILASTSLSRIRQESNDNFLERITHLHLQNKRIKNIDLLNMQKCTNLKVLYLYDNLIEEIPNLEFAKKLQYLHLENNNISNIPNFNLGLLTKLYMDENAISVMRGLDACTKLEELYVAKQRLSLGTSFEIDRTSLSAISQTLEVLDISGNAIISLVDFKLLTKLKKFYCKDNAISEISNLSVVSLMPMLEEADFTGNPCCNLRKYRDYVIGVAPMCLQVLDEMPLQKHQQVAIKGLQKHREKIGANMSMSFSLPVSLEEGFHEYSKMENMNSEQHNHGFDRLDVPDTPMGKHSEASEHASSWDEEDRDDEDDDVSVASSVA